MGPNDRLDGPEGKWVPLAYCLPISVKGIVTDGDRVCLLRNERAEWELPGGKLERGETPEACLVREVAEELGIAIEAGALVDAWVYEVLPEKEVLILTYRCHRLGNEPVHRSDEHSAVGWFTLDQMSVLSIPAGYVRSVQQVLALAG